MSDRTVEASKSEVSGRSETQATSLKRRYKYSIDEEGGRSNTLIGSNGNSRERDAGNGATGKDLAIGKEIHETDGDFQVSNDSIHLQFTDLPKDGMSSLSGSSQLRDLGSSDDANSSNLGNVTGVGRVSSSSGALETLVKVPRISNVELWDQYTITPMPNMLWTPKRSTFPREDRRISCKKCAWNTTDSRRDTSTSSLRRHLASHAKAKGKDGGVRIGRPPKGKSAVKFESETNLYDQLIRWIVTHNVQFSAIESPFFNKLIKYARVGSAWTDSATDKSSWEGVSSLATQQQLHSLIVAEFKSQQNKLVEELSYSCRSIALSYDIWTSSSTSQSTLAIVGHWINSDFQYKERALDIRMLDTEILEEGSDESGVLVNLFSEMLERFQIETKLLSLTANNSASNKALVTNLFRRLESKFRSSGLLSFRGTDSYVQCVAQVLDLIVKEILIALKSGNKESSQRARDALELLEVGDLADKSVLERIRTLSLFISGSLEQKKLWKDICLSRNLKDIIPECDTDSSWITTLNMVSQTLEVRQQITAWQAIQTVFPSFLADDWRHLQQIEKILNIFRDFAVLISNNGPQVCLAIPMYYDLHDMLQDAKSNAGIFERFLPDVSAAVYKGLQKYDQYYSFMDNQDLFYISLVLDPRLKTVLLQQDMSSPMVSDAINHIKLLLSHRYPPVFQPQDHIDSKESEQTVHSPALTKRLKQFTQADGNESDIKSYLDGATAQRSELTIEGFSWLLNWWKEQSHNYPRMGLAARDYLSIPASKISAERLLNGGHDIDELLAQKLDNGTVRMMTLLKDWYKQDVE